MITLEEALPRRISKDSAVDFAGESAFWYCCACGQWRTNKITPAGMITCPVCEAEPDWEKHEPTLAYSSRFKRVAALCAKDSPWRRHYDEVERCYGTFIDGVNTGLPLRTQEAGWRHFQSAWKTVELVADYLLTAQDVPVTDIPHTYTGQGLQRRYYDHRRRHNIATLSDLRFPHLADDSGTILSDQEATEILSLHAGYRELFYDRYFKNELFEAIKDPLERAVALAFAKNHSAASWP